MCRSVPFSYYYWENWVVLLLCQRYTFFEVLLQSVSSGHLVHNSGTTKFNVVPGRSVISFVFPDCLCEVKPGLKHMPIHSRTRLQFRPSHVVIWIHTEPDNFWARRSCSPSGSFLTQHCHNWTSRAHIAQCRMNISYYFWLSHLHIIYTFLI